MDYLHALGIIGVMVGAVIIGASRIGPTQSKDGRFHIKKKLFIIGLVIILVGLLVAIVWPR